VFSKLHNFSLWVAFGKIDTDNYGSYNSSYFWGVYIHYSNNNKHSIWQICYITPTKIMMPYMDIAMKNMQTVLMKS